MISMFLSCKLVEYGLSPCTIFFFMWKSKVSSHFSEATLVPNRTFFISFSLFWLPLMGKCTTTSKVGNFFFLFENVLGWVRFYWVAASKTPLKFSFHYCTILGFWVGWLWKCQKEFTEALSLISLCMIN